MRISFPKLKNANVAYALVLSLVLPPQSLAAADGAAACAATVWSPGYSSRNSEQLCQGAKASCSTLRKYLLDRQKEYSDMVTAACGKTTPQAKTETSGQTASFEQAENEATSAKNQVQALLDANLKLQKEIPQYSQPNTRDLKQAAQAAAGSAPEDQKASRLVTRANAIDTNFQKAVQDPKTLQNYGVSNSDVSGLNGVSGDASAQVSALERSTSFVQSLITDESKLKANLAELDKSIQNAKALKTNNGTVSTGEKTPAASTGSGAGGFLTSMLPLAAPLMGLLATQMNKDSSSAVSDPSAATDPGAAAAAGPEQAASSPLAPSNAAAGSSTTPPESPVTGAQVGQVGTTFGAPVLPEEASTVSKPGDASANSSGSRGLAGFSAGSSGSSMDSGSGSSAEKRAAAAAAAAAKPAGEEALQSFAGAGGGGLNFAGGNSAAGAHEEDPGMKDMLHDMESTVDNNPTGLFAENTEQSDAAAGVGAQDSESLFPRIKACLVRNLKKGLVMNGLGENLSELGSHQ